MTAVERATKLLLDIVGGTPGPVVETCVSEALPTLSQMPLRSNRIAKLLGIRIDNSEIERMLTRLGLNLNRKVLNRNAPGWLPVHHTVLTWLWKRTMKKSRGFTDTTMPLQNPSSEMVMPRIAEGNSLRRT